MKFKIDENLPVEIVTLLRDAGHDALSIHDQRMVGQPDRQVATVCRSENRALVTLDLDFADIRAYPPCDHAGIIVLRPQDQAKPTVVDLIVRLLPCLESEPLAQKLWLVQENRLRIRDA
ncbi:MAG: DUF5615 family PIN-like protein [Pirellulales bacterium]